MHASRLFSLFLGLSALAGLIGCDDGGVVSPGSGGTPGATGGSGGSTTGGTGGEVPASGGTAPAAGADAGPPGFGTPVYDSSGTTDRQYHKTDVKRNDLFYYFMANGWGPGFISQTITWNGTSFTVDSMEGTPGPQYQPASYPTMFCGVYSDSVSRECGLPKAVAEINQLYTGWRWNPGPNTGTDVQYNASYDIWVGNGTTVDTHNGFVMVWLHDPAGQRPRGTEVATGITVQNVPGVWNVWSDPNGQPCISYVRPEGQDTLELEFDVMDFWRDLGSHGLSLNSTHILSVAVGFEIWKGPITSLVSEDFYVDVR